MHVHLLYACAKIVKRVQIAKVVLIIEISLLHRHVSLGTTCNDRSLNRHSVGLLLELEMTVQIKSWHSPSSKVPHICNGKDEKIIS